MSANSHADGEAKMAALLDGMRKQSLGPLWRLYEQIVKREPTGVEPSHLWRWSEVHPLLDQSMQAVSGEDADHRVLLLMNPAYGGRIATTTNLLAGVQCVLPGEHTVPHRHTAAAVRYVLDSEGANTYVDGKACPMFAGDLILTPNWTWHAHENHSRERAVWIDMLDAPLTGLLNATFGARGKPAVYPQTLAALADEAFARGGLAPVANATTPRHSPRLRWTQQDVLHALQHAPAHADGSRSVRYTDPISGGALTETLDVYALEFTRGRPTAPIRRSNTALCIVMHGEGESHVGEVVHQWRARDVFTTPQWTITSHRAHSDVARLLILSDREAYRRLGLLKEELM